MSPGSSYSDILVVTTTFGSMADARRFGHELVERQYAACVQLDAVAASIYQWEGEVREEPEVRLTIKTLPSMRGLLEQFFAEHHPYEVPQFVCVVAQAREDYALWVRNNVASDV